MMCFAGIHDPFILSSSLSSHRRRFYREHYAQLATSYRTLYTPESRITVRFLAYLLLRVSGVTLLIS